MKLSTILAPMIAAKVPYEVILQTVLAYEAEQTDALEKRREHERERQARKRSKDTLSRDVTGLPRDRSLTGAGVTPVEDKPLTQKIEPQESKKQDTAARGVAEFRAKLSPLLDADLLDAFIAVRKTKRGALTGYAAGLFIGDAEKCGMSVEDAAKECVRSSWITVKLEYFGGRARASPANQAPSMSQLLQVIRDQPNENQPRPPEDRSSLRPAISHLRTVGTG